MIIGYARVSTQDQSLDTQINALRLANCDIIYEEKVSSIKQRPELERALNSLNKGDVLVIYKLDRIGRSLDDIVTIHNRLKLLSVELVSINDHIDTTTTMGKAMFGMTAVFAELERNMLSDRTKAALQTLKDNGVKLGRPDYLDIGKVKEAKKLRKQKYKTGVICDKLNISKATLFRYLKS